MWKFDLRGRLAAERHLLESPVVRHPFSTRQFQFDRTLERALARRYGLAEPIVLGRLHERIDEAGMRDSFARTGHWYDPLRDLGPEMFSLYLDFVEWLSDRLGVDFVFEANPTVRYQAPGKLADTYRLDNGNLLTMHSDTLLGDYFEQINAWLPFCDVSDSAALQMMDFASSQHLLERFAGEVGFSVESFSTGRVEFFKFVRNHPDLLKLVESTRAPAELTYGECLLFDPRILHGTADNVSDRTRVSMDFRLVPMEVYRRSLCETAAVDSTPAIVEDGLRMTMGSYFYGESAREAAASWRLSRMKPRGPKP